MLVDGRRRRAGRWERARRAELQLRHAIFGVVWRSLAGMGTQLSPHVMELAWSSLRSRKLSRVVVIGHDRDSGGGDKGWGSDGQDADLC